MAITSLERIINSTLLTKISRTSSDSSSRSPFSSSANRELTGQALYDSLRVGARNFAASIQLLNGSATFVNISLDTTEKLLEMVTKLETITTKANKGNVSASTAKRLRTEFDAITGDFDKTIDKFSTEEQDFFDVNQLQGVLSRAGLEPDKTRELAFALKRFTNPGEPTVDEDGSVVSNGNPIPLADFQRALRAAIVDPDDPSDDRSGFFGRVKEKLKTIRIQLETNITSLKDTAKLVGENISLVRAAGFAFLDVSNEMSGSESAEEIAEQIRQRIRSSARAVLSQAGNLEPIMIAGMAALSEVDE